MVLDLVHQSAVFLLGEIAESTSQGAQIPGFRNTNNVLTFTGETVTLMSSPGNGPESTVTARHLGMLGTLNATTKRTKAANEQSETVVISASRTKRNGEVVNYAGRKARLMAGLAIWGAVRTVENAVAIAEY